MTVQIDIAAAKTRLSELVARAEAGEEVIISRDGKPVVTLTPNSRPSPAKRRLGVWDHLGENIPDDLFLGPDPDSAEAIGAWDTAPIAPDWSWLDRVTGPIDDDFAEAVLEQPPEQARPGLDVFG